MSLEPIKEREVFISKEAYNASKSKMALKFEPSNDEKWTQIRGIPLSIVSRLKHSFVGHYLAY